MLRVIGDPNGNPQRFYPRSDGWAVAGVDTSDGRNRVRPWFVFRDLPAPYGRETLNGPRGRTRRFETATAAWDALVKAYGPSTLIA